MRPAGRMSSGGIARRQMLAGAAAAAMFAPALVKGAIPGGPETIAVIGAGLAGLSAAIRLRETGRRVVVLEARGVPGGRVRTIRAPFDNGLYGEAGAARVSDLHHFVLHWMNRFNLRPVPFSPEGGRTIFAADGRRAYSDDPEAGGYLFPNLREDEKGVRAADLALRYLDGVPDSLRDPETNPERWNAWHDYDRMTWPEWLRTRGASADGVKLLTLGADSSEISALYVLRQISLHRGGTGYFKIEGGMDRLTSAMAEELGEDVRYHARVLGIAQSAGGVEIRFSENGESRTMAASRVLVTVPFPVLRDIAVTPEFSDEKRAIIGQMPYRASLRFLLQTRAPFWEPRGLSGAARTDAPCEIWNGSHGQLSVNGLLSVTAGGKPGMSAHLSNLSPYEQLQWGREIADTAFPGFAAAYQKGITQNWTDDPFSRGAFAVFHPGQMTRWGEKAYAPEGRVHFAGDHVSPWPGWMEGALWSAERALQELL
jgi:monoamine oxidase